MPLVWINNQLIDKNEAMINVFDHGFLHGDGIFEGMRLYGGKVFLLQKHLANLRESAARIELKIPQTDAEITAAINQTLAANPRQEGYIRVIVTRGPGTLALDPRKCESSLIVIVDEIGLYPRELVESGMHVTVLPVLFSLPLGGSLARGSLVPMRFRALQDGYCEALLSSARNKICAAIEAVPFLKVGQNWHVPAKSESDACPVMRELVCELLPAVVESDVKLEQLPDVQEGLLACAAAGIVPIDRIDDLVLPHAIGPDTRQLRERFREMISGTNGAVPLE
jgi:branched-chain amino acid aminotransferase